jgi:hypothetical protein
MSAKTIEILPSYSYTYVNRDGETVEKTVTTRGPNGAMKLHPGGSAYLGMLTLCASVCGVVLVLEGIVARIRVDGAFVLEPTKRDEEWFDGNGVSHPGGFIFEIAGDESRQEFAKQVAKQIPALAKRVKSARAAIAKRAA